MAIGNSGLFLKTWIDVLDTTQLALNLDLTSHKVALFTDTLTPNYSTDTAYGVSPYNANEVSGTGYTAGGVTLANTAVSDVSGTLKWDGDDVQWTTSTITGAKGALIYADALAGKNAIVLVNLGGTYSTSAGTLLVSWNSLGIVNLDLTP
ncbi:MAG: hypothetical protein ABR585_07650 [Gemmatimonadaceae bacterium]